MKLVYKVRIRDDTRAISSAPFDGDSREEEAAKLLARLNEEARFVEFYDQDGDAMLVRTEDIQVVWVEKVPEPKPAPPPPDITEHTLYGDARYYEPRRRRKKEKI
jgi:hypothetical protein